MEENKAKINRLQFWAVFLIIIGGISAYFMPEHSIESFFSLLGEIIRMIAL